MTKCCFGTLIACITIVNNSLEKKIIKKKY